MSHIEPDFTQLSAQALLQREYVHELEQLVLNLASLVSGCSDLDEDKMLERHDLLQRVTHLLLHKKPFHEPLEGISGI